MESSTLKDVCHEMNKRTRFLLEDVHDVDSRICTLI